MVAGSFGGSYLQSRINPHREFIEDLQIDSTTALLIRVNPDHNQSIYVLVIKDGEYKLVQVKDLINICPETTYKSFTTVEALKEFLISKEVNHVIKYPSFINLLRGYFSK